MKEKLHAVINWAPYLMLAAVIGNITLYGLYQRAYISNCTTDVGLLYESRGWGEIIYGLYGFSLVSSYFFIHFFIIWVALMAFCKYKYGTIELSSKPKIIAILCLLFFAYLELIDPFFANSF